MATSAQHVIVSCEEIEPMDCDLNSKRENEAKVEKTPSSYEFFGAELAGRHRTFTFPIPDPAHT